MGRESQVRRETLLLIQPLERQVSDLLPAEVSFFLAFKVQVHPYLLLRLSLELASWRSGCRSTAHGHLLLSLSVSPPTLF